jgi:hypothetical protein
MAAPIANLGTRWSVTSRHVRFNPWERASVTN